MWYDTRTGLVARTHSDARALRKDWAAPLVLTDEMIEDVGFMPIVQTSPVFDPATQVATELAPAFISGAWTQEWEVQNLPADVVASIAAAYLAAEQVSIAEYLDTVRELRERILNRLAGIAAVALISADSTTTAAFIAARQRLLDITKLGGATKGEVESRVKAEYMAIVMATAPALRNAFNTVGA